ncbi:MAG: hypothetical protein FWG14_10480 [Peptococcaceae bacterium]|nr:hypothetical protein [Peptococcaceae bacterium]
MKNKIVIVSIFVFLFLGGLIVVLGTWWFRPPPPLLEEIGVNKDMRDTILKQMSENPQEALTPLITVDTEGQKIYAWQPIEELLHREAVNMEIADYVTLLQVVESMTLTQDTGTATTDFEAIGQLIQRGYKGAYLTSTMANLCILYKEWVENYVLAEPQTYVLFGARDTEELKATSEHLEQAMFKVAILNGILMNDNEIAQSKERISQHIPEIAITYEKGENYLMDHYLLQIGDKAVKVYPFHRSPHHPIGGERGNVQFLPWDDTQKLRKVKEYTILGWITQAYDVAAALSVTENGNIQLVVCFNETELEIRALSYGFYAYNSMEEPKDPKYLNFTAMDLKDLYYSNPTQNNEYTEWWNKYGIRDTDNYKDELREALSKYPGFSTMELKRLTPAQIRELGKKIKDPSYTPNLGDVP